MIPIDVFNTGFAVGTLLVAIILLLVLIKSEERKYKKGNDENE